MPSSGPAPLQVLFTAQGSDPDGDVLTYAWNFGDGSTGTGRRARHTYTANGTYTATVTAKDSAGNTATDTVQIVVGNPAGNQAPTVQIAASKTTRQGAAERCSSRRPGPIRTATSSATCGTSVTAARPAAPRSTTSTRRPARTRRR